MTYTAYSNFVTRDGVEVIHCDDPELAQRVALCLNALAAIPDDAVRKGMPVALSIAWADKAMAEYRAARMQQMLASAAQMFDALGQLHYAKDCRDAITP